MNYNILYLLISLILLTPLRGGVLIIMPIIPLLLYKIQPFRIDVRKVRILLILFFISSIVSLLLDWDCWANIILSIWLFVPILILLYVCPKYFSAKISIDKFINVSVKILFVIDLIGLYYWMKLGGDEYGKGYGMHYEYVHGLAIVNLMYLFYYVAKIIKKKAVKKDYIYSIPLLISFFICQFGLGTISLFLTILVCLALERKFKFLAILFITFSLGIAFLQLDYFAYERHNVEEALVEPQNARKILMFESYGDLIQQNILIPILGVGPGAYNSRTMILLREDSENVFTYLLGNTQPRFFHQYIYPLWNSTLVSFENYTDGTRNKPYSSLVAIFAEYGIIFGVILFITIVKRIFFFSQKKDEDFLYYYLEILYVFMFISLVLHEWIVTSEFILFLIINYFTLNTIFYKRKNKKE